LKKLTIILIFLLAFISVSFANRARKNQIGLPSKIYVLGTIDPDKIRGELRKELPRFNKCGKEIADAVAIDTAFTIEPNGRVIKEPLITGKVNTKTKKCFQNILMSIKFVSKKSHGRTDVRQIFNIL